MKSKEKAVKRGLVQLTRGIEEVFAPNPADPVSAVDVTFLLAALDRLSEDMTDLESDRSRPPIEFIRAFLPLATALNAAHITYLLSDGWNQEFRLDLATEPRCLAMETTMLFFLALDIYSWAVRLLSRCGDELVSSVRSVLPPGELTQLMTPIINAMEAVSQGSGPLAGLLAIVRERRDAWHDGTLPEAFAGVICGVFRAVSAAAEFSGKTMAFIDMKGANSEVKAAAKRLHSLVPGVLAALSLVFVDSSKGTLPPLNPGTMNSFLHLIVNLDVASRGKSIFEGFEQDLTLELTTAVLHCLPELPDGIDDEEMFRRYSAVGLLLWDVAKQANGWLDPAPRDALGQALGPAAVYLRLRTKKRPSAFERPLERALVVTLQALRAQLRLKAAHLAEPDAAFPLDRIVADMDTLAMLVEELVPCVRKAADSGESGITEGVAFQEHLSYFAAGVALSAYFLSISHLLRASFELGQDQAPFQSADADKVFKLMRLVRMVGVLECSFMRLVPSPGAKRPEKAAWAVASPATQQQIQAVLYLGAMESEFRMQFGLLAKALHHAVVATSTGTSGDQVVCGEAFEAFQAICCARRLHTRWLLEAQAACIGGVYPLGLSEAVKQRAPSMDFLNKMGDEMRNFLFELDGLNNSQSFVPRLRTIWAVTLVDAFTMRDYAKAWNNFWGNPNQNLELDAICLKIETNASRIADMLASVGETEAPEVALTRAQATLHCSNLRCASAPARPERKVVRRECAGCGCAGYCSAACQRADWRRHKAACRLMAKGRTTGDEDKENQSCTTVSSRIL